MGNRSITEETVPGRWTSVNRVAFGKSSQSNSSTFSPPLMPTSQSCTRATFRLDPISENIRRLFMRWDETRLHPGDALPILFRFLCSTPENVNIPPYRRDYDPARAPRGSRPSLPRECHRSPVHDRSDPPAEAPTPIGGILSRTRAGDDPG